MIDVPHYKKRLQDLEKRLQKRTDRDLYATKLDRLKAYRQQ